MKTLKLIAAFFFATFLAVTVTAQDTVWNYDQQNAAARLLGTDSRITIGGYAQIDYNQPLDAGRKMNGKLDVHRLVLLFGYKFTDRIQFVTEIEMEHVKELYVEQAFLQYKVNDWLNFRGGLLLIPMGIINEYHEPPSYHGVERPNLDYYITPTTWREIGLGATGTIRPAFLKYQLYMVNGFLSYDGEGLLGGKSGFRSGRQKGAEAITLIPNVTGKVEYYGVRGLNIGVSGYFGNSNSTLYKSIEKSNDEAILHADSSVVGISMVGADARYSIKGVSLRGQLYYASFNNVSQYNEFTGKDLGKSMFGYYAELAYDVFSSCDGIKSQLEPFLRYERYNTHNTVSVGTPYNPAYNREEVIFGLGWRPVSGVAVKADLQFYRVEGAAEFAKQFNAGIGVWF